MSSEAHSATSQYRQVLSQLADDVDREIDATFRADGYVDEHGEPSDEAMRAATLNIILEQCVANSKAERSRKALTKGELYKLVFPSGPTDDEANNDPVKERVLAKLASLVWGLTQTTRSGYIQRELEAADTTLVLCRTSVFRQADKKQAVYATDSEKLIKEDAVDKEVKALAKKASALRKDLNMLLERHPKLRPAIAAQLATELRKIEAELSFAEGSANGSTPQVAA